MAALPPNDFEDRLATLEGRVELLERDLIAQPPPPTGTPTTPPSYIPKAAPTRSTTLHWPETITTEVMLKWAGLLLLFLATVFLVSTAISRGWIGPELQLIGAVSLGGILIGVGVRPTVRIRAWAASLISVGVAILFTSAGAASEWLDLGGIGRGVLATIGVGIIGVGLAHWVRSILVASTAFSGLIAIPIWLEAFDEYGLAAAALFTLALAIVFHGLYVDRSWPALFFGVAVTLMIVQFAAAFDQESTALVQILFVATALLHWFAPVVHRVLHPASDLGVHRLAARIELVVPSGLWASTIALHDLERGWTMMLIAAAITVASIISALGLRAKVPRWLFATQVLAGSIVFSVGLMAWLDGSTLLGALAVQALAMLALSERFADSWFRWQSVLTAGLILVIAVALTLSAIEIDVSWGSDAIHLFVFLATGAIGWYLRHTTAGQVLALAAYCSLLVWVASAFVHVEQGQLIISAVWAAIGLAVVVGGLGNRISGVARVGLATLGLVVGKLLSIDLSEIDTFWRAGLFFVIGLGFLWLSYEVPSLLGKEPAVDDT